MPYATVFPENQPHAQRVRLSLMGPGGPSHMWTGDLEEFFAMHECTEEQQQGVRADISKTGRAYLSVKGPDLLLEQVEDAALDAG